MAPSSTINSKGQITVPLEVRLRLGLKEGDRVEFVAEDNRTVIRPVQPEVNPFDEFAGVFPTFNTIEEINAWVRDMRDDEPDILELPLYSRSIGPR